ncbi:MAG: helix-turn-helix domain-containing protein [Colwellia sp.]
MENLNAINLIQAATLGVSLLGALLLWTTKSNAFKGIALLLALIALASFINILEESRLTRDIYLISPVFIMLFGPATYLATKLLIDNKLAKMQLWHLAPVIVFLMLTSHVQLVILVGTFWRIGYIIATAMMLFRYKRLLDEERSDADEISLNWLAWLLGITTAFNVLDLIRLNTQQLISYDLNILGQGLNNTLWFVVVIIITIKLQSQKHITLKHQSVLDEPLLANANQEKTTLSNKELENKKCKEKDLLGQETIEEDYGSIFNELDQLFIKHQWFRRPRITLSEVSNLTGLQTRDISRAINTIKGHSFNDYINQYRIDYVCKLFNESPNKSVLDVAQEAGFSSKASFNKVFKDSTNLTPTQYKQDING